MSSLIKSSKNVDVLFVGKGVCFDSGGISLKPIGNGDMKWDMVSGSYAIMKYLSEINPKLSYAALCLVENMPVYSI